MITKHTLLVFLCLCPLSQAFSQQNAATQKYDTSLPIEINADSLEVDQANQTAFFSGNVEALQGKIKLRSDRMTVYYRSENQQKEAASAPVVAGTSKISRVKVQGNVNVTTPDETAKGNEGIYDVGHSTIELEGNVTLTQGKNIIQGDKLVYNLDTGKSRVSSNMDNKGKETKKTRGRVKSVFIPEKK